MKLLATLAAWSILHIAAIQQVPAASYDRGAVAYETTQQTSYQRATLVAQNDRITLLTTIDEAHVYQQLDAVHAVVFVLKPRSTDTRIALPLLQR